MDDLQTFLERRLKLLKDNNGDYNEELIIDIVSSLKQCGIMDNSGNIIDLVDSNF
jgi:hypothetical protein